MSQTSKQRYQRKGTIDSECVHCGLAAHEHDTERVVHQDGTFSYDYYCPTGGSHE